MLRRAEPLAALLAELEQVERLVMLGDVIELRHQPVREPLAASERVFRSIGAALGPGGEVVIVPGNHDHWLLRGWLERRARLQPPPPLGHESEVSWREGEALADLARWLAPAALRVSYPGVWLRQDVYATHGHYLDRHTTVPVFERLGAAVMARIVGEAPEGPSQAEDYEAVLAPMYAWIHAVAQAGGLAIGASSHDMWRAVSNAGGRRPGLRRRARVVAFPLAVAVLGRAGLGPLRADLSGPELRRASLAAFGEVCDRLALRARYVIFGHTHRPGPLPRDDGALWRAGNSALLNAGNWVYERQFVAGPPARSPYWPGTCILVPDTGAPELRSLLKDRSHEELAPRG